MSACLSSPECLSAEVIETSAGDVCTHCQGIVDLGIEAPKKLRAAFRHPDYNYDEAAYLAIWLRGERRDDGMVVGHYRNTCWHIMETELGFPPAGPGRETPWATTQSRIGQNADGKGKGWFVKLGGGMYGINPAVAAPQRIAHLLMERDLPPMVELPVQAEVMVKAHKRKSQWRTEVHNPVSEPITRGDVEDMFVVGERELADIEDRPASLDAIRALSTLGLDETRAALKEAFAAAMTDPRSPAYVALRVEVARAIRQQMAAPQAMLG